MLIIIFSYYTVEFAAQWQGVTNMVIQKTCIFLGHFSPSGHLFNLVNTQKHKAEVTAREVMDNGFDFK